MGLIKEPSGIDFIINSELLTKEEEEKLSEFIAKRKMEIAEMKHQRPAKTKGKREVNVKTKPRSKQQI